MKKCRFIITVLVVFLAVSMLAACGGAKKAPATIKIGVPNPSTGAIASFGVGTPWAEQLVVDAVNANGGIFIQEFNKKIPLEIVVVDTESNPTKAAEVTQQLVAQSKVNMLIARHTPDTALPVSATGETLSIPTVSLECPVDPWLEGGPYKWVYHSFWRVETLCRLYMGMWEKLGLGGKTGKTVGFLFPNDADGLSWAKVMKPILEAAGYKISDPGRYQIFTDDWTAVINQFKADGVTIITGNDIPPHFSGFAAQAAQQGLKYDIITVARSYLYPSDANALPIQIANGLTCEVWWSPWHPFSSSVTGMTAQELADLYEKEFKITWSAPMGYKYAGMEIAVDALTRAASLDPEKIRAAIASTNLNTMIGPIKYDQGSHVAETPVVGGQWFLNDAKNGVELKIVYNDNYPAIPVNGALVLPKK